MYNRNYFQKHTDHYLAVKDLGQVPSFAWIRKELGVRAGEKVLDAGCGTGYLLNFVMGEKRKGTGLDLSGQAVKRARKLFPRHRFLKGDLTALPFGGGEFDKVFCFNVIEHLKKKDQEKALEELERVLKRKGVLVAGTNIKNSFSWRLFKLFVGGDPSHLGEFSAREFTTFIGTRFEIRKTARSSCIARFPGPVNRLGHRFLKGDILVKGVRK